MGHKIGYKKSAPISGDNGLNSFEPDQPLAFFKTIRGILKAVSVLIGLFATITTAVGYSQARLFIDTENTAFCKSTVIPGQTIECWKGSYYRDEICEDFNNRQKLLRELPLRTCPRRWYIVIPMYFTGFVWGATCIVLLILLFVDMSAYRSFTITDWVGYTIGGIMTLISASLVGVYYYKVMDEDMCSRETIQTEIRYKIQKSYGGHWSFFKNLTATRISEREANCSQSDTYFHWGFLFVGISTFVLGVLYIAIAVMAMMGTRSNAGAPVPVPVQSLATSSS